MESSLIGNKETTIEFIDSESGATNNRLPFVIIPGLSESAEDYIPLMKLLSSRCIAISLRGRGKSDAPKMGYSLEDHISDIKSVIKHLKLDEFILMGFSRGVSYALGYAFTNLNSVKGIVLGDYPAHHTQLPPEWVDYFLASPPWRGKSVSERMKPHAIDGIQRDSKQVSFWDKLNLIQSPILIIQGGKEGSALSVEDSVQYLEKISKADLIVFEESNHNIFEPDLDKFVNVVEEFIENL
ncbi:alpha/beta hydrolase [Sporosarcina sp. E16_3]|uniref:alpha/beta fold hydrolase n=1 Tax=Sporosarcina sp. E16_3 TaxID=2789293 RepID=UPI001A927FD9|nr:alpha/beta hydrolase [Sporosarcina sp. E16_3]MBO0600033.1 alpha/beta hydrolase [Sporosarcina sp. E16_3]